MKRLLLLFALLALLALPALADDSKGDSDKEIDNEAITFARAVFPIYLDSNGQHVRHGGCVEGARLTHFAISFTPPGKTPDAYLIRWSARKNGTWRATDKPNAEKAGNLTIKHSDIFDIFGSILIDIGYRYDGRGKNLKVPAGQALNIKMRPIYGKSKGPKLEFAINDAAWINRAFGDQTAACA